MIFTLSQVMEYGISMGKKIMLIPTADMSLGQIILKKVKNNFQNSRIFLNVCEKKRILR